jgi:hypothetical protein
MQRWLTNNRFTWASILILLALTGLVALTAPEEQTLGGPNARLVYFHGALVWASLLTWFLAAGAGLIGLIRRDIRFHTASKVLGRVGLLWWALYIPVSILAANATWANNTWNLSFLMEPRFQVAFQMIALMLVAQAVVLFSNHPAAPSLTNLIVVVIMVLLLNVTERVLHPPAPIRDTESLRIQLAFAVMTLLLLLAGFQIARLRRAVPPQSRASG